MKTVKVVIDRPIHSKHPLHDIYYELNYGYVEGIIAADGEEQDVYVLDVNHPIKEYEGKVIAIIKRFDDVEDKWCVSNKDFSIEEIKKLTHFQEQYFNIEIIKLGGKQ